MTATLYKSSPCKKNKQWKIQIKNQTLYSGHYPIKHAGAHLFTKCVASTVAEVG